MNECSEGNRFERIDVIHMNEDGKWDDETSICEYVRNHMKCILWRRIENWHWQLEREFIRK